MGARVNKIEKTINEKLSLNKDRTLSISNVVCITLDDFSTIEIAEFYKELCETDLRYFLEQRIASHFMYRKPN